MIIRKVIAVFVLALASLVVLTDAHATDIDQATKLTFSQPFQIPGRVLPAGTYWFVVPSHDVVQILSEDRMTRYATLLTIHAERLEPSDQSQITIAERGTMRPTAIVTWFYPGRTDGHEFLYSKQDAKEIAQAKQHTVVVGKEIAQAEQRTAPVEEGNRAD
jgi:hypothetical protein